VTGVIPSESSTVPPVGRPVIFTLNCDGVKLASAGAEIPIGVAGLFLGTIDDVQDVTTGLLLGPIDSVAVADAVFPSGSETVNAKVELAPKALIVGLNFKPVSCAKDKDWPAFTGVIPSANSTIPSDGSLVTVTVNAEEAKLESTGDAMPIDVAKLFSATVSDELSVSVDMDVTLQLDTIVSFKQR